MAIGNLVKVFGWYDNEWGYSNRLVDLSIIIGARQPVVAATIPVLEDLPRPRGASGCCCAPTSTCRSRTAAITDDLRIRATLPTIEWLQRHGAHVTACTHLGRPKGEPDPTYSVAPVRERLAELAPGVELLENLRFDPGEEANDPAFVDRLVDGFDAYVNDAFGASHRAHASIVGPPQRLPERRRAGCWPRRSRCCSVCATHPRRPFVAVLGGAKVSDKLGVIDALLDTVDALVIGGGMCFTFLAAQGHADRRLAVRARSDRRVQAPPRAATSPSISPSRRDRRSARTARCASSAPTSPTVGRGSTSGPARPPRSPT